MLALISIVSESSSPITIFPPNVMLPSALILPSTCRSPVIFVLELISTSPVPFGRNSKLALELKVEIVFCSIRKSSISNFVCYTVASPGDAVMFIIGSALVIVFPVMLISPTVI